VPFTHRSTKGAAAPPDSCGVRLCRRSRSAAMGATRQPLAQALLALCLLQHVYADSAAAQDSLLATARPGQTRLVGGSGHFMPLSSGGGGSGGSSGRGGSSSTLGALDPAGQDASDVAWQLDGSSGGGGGGGGRSRKGPDAAAGGLANSAAPAGPDSDGGGSAVSATTPGSDQGALGQAAAGDGTQPAPGGDTLLPRRISGMSAAAGGTSSGAPVSPTRMAAAADSAGLASTGGSFASQSPGAGSATNSAGPGTPGSPVSASASSTQQSIPGMGAAADSAADSGGASATGATGAASMPLSISGEAGAEGAAAARQLRHAPGGSARRLQQGDPRVDQFAYGGTLGAYGGAMPFLGSAADTLPVPSLLGQVLGSVPAVGRRLQQAGDPAARRPAYGGYGTTGAMLPTLLGQGENGLPGGGRRLAQAIPGLPDFSPFAPDAPADPTAAPGANTERAGAGAYSGPAARRLQTAPAGAAAGRAFARLPGLQRVPAHLQGVHAEALRGLHAAPGDQLPVSVGEGGNTLRRRRRRAAAGAAHNPSPDTSVGTGPRAESAQAPPARRRLAQFVPLHGGPLAGGVVAPGLFRPTGSYDRRR